MKILAFVPILILFTQKVDAQSDRIITLGYYGPFVIQPGIKLGAEFPLKNLDPDHRNGNNRGLSIRPQAAYFTQTGLHRNFLIETDLAYTLKKSGKESYFRPSVGMGYLFSREHLEGRVNLGTGKINQIKENLHYFVPTINLEVGKLPKKRLGYFFKGFFGNKMTGNQPNSAFFGIEAGLKILWEKTENE